MKEIKIKDHIMREMMEDAFYNQVDPRRRQEKHDGNMIKEDKSATANLSEKHINKIFNPDRFKHDSLSAGAPDCSDY